MIKQSISSWEINYLSAYFTYQTRIQELKIGNLEFNSVQLG